jgi:hypothetical protein
MKIYDNAIDQEIFNEITKIIFSYDFPWYWGGTAYTEKIDTNLAGFSFAHTAILAGKHNASVSRLLEGVVKELLKHTGEKLVYLDRVRLGLITHTDQTFYHPPHVDLLIPHRTGLFYLNDSDGDTYIYNEKFDMNSKLTDFEQYQNVKDNLTLMQQITPKANRFVAFDGLHYHNSSTPTTVPRRLVMNFNYLTEDLI